MRESFVRIDLYLLIKLSCFVTHVSPLVRCLCSLSDLCNFAGVDYESDESDNWQAATRRSASLSSDMSALSCVSVMPAEELDRLLDDVKSLGDSNLQVPAAGYRTFCCCSFFTAAKQKSVDDLPSGKFSMSLTRIYRVILHILYVASDQMQKLYQRINITVPFFFFFFLFLFAPHSTGLQ